MQIHIEAVADAPNLWLTPHPGAHREIFRTGFESVTDHADTSRNVITDSLEGRTLVTGPDPFRGGMNGFEIWSSGDRQQNALHRLVTVQAVDGNGRNFLELNNTGTTGLPQTLGIERTVPTVAGATYTLTLDYAGRPGFGKDYTAIAICVDGQRIGHHAKVDHHAPAHRGIASTSDRRHVELVAQRRLLSIR